MEIKTIQPGGVLTDALWIRDEVFTKEQGFLQPDEDAFDPLSNHVVIYEQGNPVATGRCYADPARPQEYHIGRICVVKELRGHALGRILMERLEEISSVCGAQKLVLGAQVYAMPFYERCGYTAFGDRYFDEHCEHQMMGKTIG